MKFHKLAQRAFSSGVHLAKKFKKEDVHTLGKKTFHHAKQVEDALSEENVNQYTNKAKDIGSRITKVAGVAADVSDKVGKVANALGMTEVGNVATKFSKVAKGAHDKGKKAGEILGY